MSKLDKYFPPLIIHAGSYTIDHAQISKEIDLSPTVWDIDDNEYFLLERRAYWAAGQLISVYTVFNEEFQYKKLMENEIYLKYERVTNNPIGKLLYG